MRMISLDFKGSGLALERSPFDNIIEDISHLVADYLVLLDII